MSLLFILLGTPHYIFVTQVHEKGPLVKGLMLRLLPQQSEPFVSQSFLFKSRPIPNTLEIAFIAEILRDSYRIVKI